MAVAEDLAGCSDRSTTLFGLSAALDELAESLDRDPERETGAARQAYGLLPDAEPPASWSGVRDATRQAPACLQFQPTGVRSGSYATLDQIQALTWIRGNIRAFGGDPQNVTIAGQSAGAGSVCTLMTSPLATGLFQRAIIESLGCGRATQPIAGAEQQGGSYASTAGCTDPATVLACLRSAWAPNLIAAEQKVVVRAEAYGTGVLPQESRTAIAQGHWNKVPVLIGGVRWEGKLFVINQAGLTAQGYVQQIQATYGANAPAVLARYPLSDYAAPFYALAAVTTDSGIGCAANGTADLLAGLTTTYRYEFNDPTSPTLYGFQPPGIDMSNAHSAELAYLFDFTLGDRPLTRTELALSRQMMKYWAAFARSGDPNVAGQAAWPPFQPGSTRTLVLRPTGNTVATGIAAEHNCAFWASLSE